MEFSVLEKELSKAEKIVLKAKSAAKGYGAAMEKAYQGISAILAQTSKLKQKEGVDSYSFMLRKSVIRELKDYVKSDYHKQHVKQSKRIVESRQQMPDPFNAFSIENIISQVKDQIQDKLRKPVFVALASAFLLASPASPSFDIDTNSWKPVQTNASQSYNVTKTSNKIVAEKKQIVNAGSQYSNHQTKASNYSKSSNLENTLKYSNSSKTNSAKKQEQKKPFNIIDFFKNMFAKKETPKKQTVNTNSTNRMTTYQPKTNNYNRTNVVVVTKNSDVTNRITTYQPKTNSYNKTNIVQVTAPVKTSAISNNSSANLEEKVVQSNAPASQDITSADSQDTKDYLEYTVKFKDCLWNITKKAYPTFSNNDTYLFIDTIFSPRNGKGKMSEYSLKDISKKSPHLIHEGEKFKLPSLKLMNPQEVPESLKKFVSLGNGNSIYKANLYDAKGNVDRIAYFDFHSGRSVVESVNY